jgi:hypothetical protein
LFTGGGLAAACFFSLTGAAVAATSSIVAVDASHI